jgi:hypothetical protein
VDSDWLAWLLARGSLVPCAVCGVRSTSAAPADLTRTTVPRCLCQPAAAVTTRQPPGASQAGQPLAGKRPPGTQDLGDLRPGFRCPKGAGLEPDAFPGSGQPVSDIADHRRRDQIHPVTGDGYGGAVNAFPGG